MSQSHAAWSHPIPARPYAADVRHVSTDAPLQWLAGGWRDFRAAPGASLSYGMLFVIAGLAMAWALHAANMMYLFVPLATGFMLVGPAVTLGFYAISRDLEQGKRPGFATALFAYRANPGPLLYVGFALLAMMMVWMRLSELLFAFTFPTTAGPDLWSLTVAAFTSVDGLLFLAMSLGLGAVMAALTFAGSAFALPLLFDREVGMVEAVATSWTAVEMNLPAMAVWAALLVALSAAGMLVGFIGLAVTLPVAGHATWHAYRAVIARPASGPTR